MSEEILEVEGPPLEAAENDLHILNDDKSQKEVSEVSSSDPSLPKEPENNGNLQETLFKVPEDNRFLANSTPDKQSPASSEVPKVAVDPTIPSPFKRVLFWPEEKPSTSKVKRREKLPSVITSPQNILYFKKKQAEKQKKAEEQVRRKKEREDKQKAILEKKANTEKNKKSRKEKTSQRKMHEDSDSTSISDSVSDDSSSEYDADFEVHGDDEQSFEAVEVENLIQGDFILCQFLGGKRNQTKFIYLCVVQEIEQDMSIQVMGLKSTDKLKKEFIINETDVSFVNINQVIGRVDHPEIVSRGERFSYLFPKPLPVKEM